LGHKFVAVETSSPGSRNSASNGDSWLEFTQESWPTTTAQRKPADFRGHTTALAVGS
jgi:hypothetical protein